MRVGHVRAGHADHVKMAFGDGVARGGDVGDARGVKHRQTEFRLHCRGQLEIGRGRRSHDRDDVAQRLVGLDPPLDDVQEIHPDTGDQATRDLEALVAADRPLLTLVDHQPQANDEVLARLPADFLQHLEGKSQAVVQAAAVVVLPPVRRRRPEGVHEMAVALQLDAVEAAFLAAQRRRAIGLHHTANVVVLHLLGEGAVRRLAHHRRGNDRQPVVLVPVGAPAKMGDLAHHGAAMAVAAVRQGLKPRNDGVVPDMEITEGIGRIDRHHRRPADHGERDPALGLFLVVETVALLGQAILGIKRLVAGRHDPVLERQVFQLKRLQQGIAARHSSSPGGRASVRTLGLAVKNQPAASLAVARDRRRVGPRSWRGP